MPGVAPMDVNVIKCSCKGDGCENYLDFLDFGNEFVDIIVYKIRDGEVKSGVSLALSKEQIIQLRDKCNEALSHE